MGQLLSFVPDIPVFIVDDDPSVRETLVLLLKIEGYVPSGQGRVQQGSGRLGISPRTVEVHRARIMDKLGAKNAADLIRIVLSEASARRRLSAS